MASTPAPTAPPTTPAVYRCIAQVAGAIAQEGIAKARKNQQQGYSFRGIDDVYNALSSQLAKHGLVILPRVLSRELTERTTAKGGVLFNIVVEVEFDFVAAEDGSTHTIKTFGEAMDSADKATNKAMSAAYKYAAMQTFCIPTEGDNDADAHSHSIVPTPAQPARPAAPAPRPASRNGAPPAGAPQAQQPAPTQARSDRQITVATARRRLMEAGLTAEGAGQMFAELSPGAASLDALPDPILRRFATTGASDEEISRWNDCQVDAPATWQQPVAAG